MEEKKKIKVIFLDVDGVLNSEDFFRGRHGLENTRAKVKGSFNRRHIDTIRVGLLNEIIDKTGAEIVLSSCWRWSDPVKNKALSDEFVRKCGFRKPLYDVTTRRCKLGTMRGHEIKEWLDDHAGEVEAYVILDDDMDMLEEQQPYFIHTHWRHGLTCEEVDRAVEILNANSNKNEDNGKE